MIVTVCALPGCVLTLRSLLYAPSLLIWGYVSGRSAARLKLSETEMNARLIDLYRKARLDLEEGGANTLFISIGFLHWKETQDSEKVWKAPLILLPVKLERQTVQSGFRLIRRDEEPLLNPTLIEMLRQDFHLTLPDNLENQLPTDHSGLDIAKILRLIRHAIRDIKGWEVTDEVVLGTFSFTKYLMWKDLQDNSELLKENSVVRHLIDTRQAMNSLFVEWQISWDLGD